MMQEARQAGWGAEALWQRLAGLLPGLSVEVLARVESTNTELLERARAASRRGDTPIPRGRRATTSGSRMNTSRPCGRAARRLSIDSVKASSTRA